MQNRNRIQTDSFFSGKRQALFLIPVLILITLFYPGQSLAQGNLLITPRRVVFDGNKRIQELNLANTGKDSATYQISFKEIRMTENGGFEEITQPDPGQNFASKYLRFFPRRVTLGPKEAQVVKLQLSRTNQLQAGEYRSHMYFRAVPKEKPLGEKEAGSASSTLSVKLVPVFGITIPVIIRRGESTASVSMVDLALEGGADSTPNLGITLQRTGNMSVYGDITVKHISPAGKVRQVGLVKGIAVYTPTAKRRFRINLDQSAGVDYGSGKLQLIYKGQKDAEYAQLAEAELQLN
ncbi:MAG: molecular chaperone [Marinifilaceae bacterium]